MKNPGRLAALCTLALAGFAAAGTHAAPTNGWMTQEAMRGAFIGKTLDGHYVDGLRWTETYSAEGRLDYRESARKGLGHWYFRGNVFCTFYDPGYGLNGGCWTAIKASANCYEFYIAGLNDGRTEDEAAPGPLGSWAARAWRKGEPSTCQDKPSVTTAGTTAAKAWVALNLLAHTVSSVVIPQAPFPLVPCKEHAHVHIPRALHRRQLGQAVRQVPGRDQSLQQQDHR